MRFSLIQQIMITCDVKRGVVSMNPDWAYLCVNALNAHSIRFEAIRIQCILKRFKCGHSLRLVVVKHTHIPFLKRWTLLLGPEQFLRHHCFSSVELWIKMTVVRLV